MVTVGRKPRKAGDYPHIFTITRHLSVVVDPLSLVLDPGDQLVVNLLPDIDDGGPCLCKVGILSLLLPIDVSINGIVNYNGRDKARHGIPWYVFVGVGVDVESDYTYMQHVVLEVPCEFLHS